MKFTNRHNLPETLLRAARVNDTLYDKGNADRSVTQLISPPRIDTLRKAHFVEIEKDLSEEWWALFGSAVHHILEMGAGPNDYVEERLFLEIDGWIVSGKADLQEYRKNGDGWLVTVSDYKVTTAYALMQKDAVKPEWVAQLNCLAYLLQTNRPDCTVDKLQLVAIIRDWQRTQAAIDPLYPQSPVVALKVPLWSMKKQMNYLHDRVGQHRTTEMLYALDVPLPECTDEERWMRESKWAVIKKGGKKASKVFDNPDAAEDDLLKRKPGYEVQYRPGKSTRCEGNYCQVAEFCDQWTRIKESASSTPDESETEQEQTA